MGFHEKSQFFWNAPTIEGIFFEGKSRPFDQGREVWRYHGVQVPVQHSEGQEQRQSRYTAALAILLSLPQIRANETSPQSIHDIAERAIGDSTTPQETLIAVLTVYETSPLPMLGAEGQLEHLVQHANMGGVGYQFERAVAAIGYPMFQANKFKGGFAGFITSILEKCNDNIRENDVPPFAMLLERWAMAVHRRPELMEFWPEVVSLMVRHTTFTGYLSLHWNGAAFSHFVISWLQTHGRPPRIPGAQKIIQDYINYGQTCIAAGGFRPHIKQHVQSSLDNSVRIAARILGLENQVHWYR